MWLCWRAGSGCGSRRPPGNRGVSRLGRSGINFRVLGVLADFGGFFIYYFQFDPRVPPNDCRQMR
jgi:hypothetical protein